MKKNLLFIAVILAIILFGCKKNPTEDPIDPPQLLGSENPVELSKNVKVWHGIRLAGTPPSPTGGADAPKIEDPGVRINAFAGKFAILQPEVVSGSIAGYYVGINGANEYFKIDYTKPRNTEGPIRRKPRLRLGNLQSPTGTDSIDDNLDSAIVLILPTSIKTPDTFCITYCPYDLSGNIGDPITTCIIVNQLGGDASSNWLHGGWRFFAGREDANESFDTIIYNKWIPEFETGRNEYFCSTDTAGNQTVTNYCNSPFSVCTVLSVVDSSIEYKFDIFFNNNGDMQYIDSTRDKYVDHNTGASTCSNIVFTDITYNDINTGGWTINGNKLILIFEFYDGLPEYDVLEFEIQKISDNEFRIKDDYDGYEAIYKKL